MDKKELYVCIVQDYANNFYEQMRKAWAEQPEQFRQIQEKSVENTHYEDIYELILTAIKYIKNLFRDF